MVGVTKYSKLPSVVLLGLISTSAIVVPHDEEHGLPPEMDPVFVPKVQVNVLGILAVNPIERVVPLQLAWVGVVVTTGNTSITTVSLVLIVWVHAVVALVATIV